ncbi:di-heme enzyme [Oscillatoria sp. CS-180]|uniref:methanobactin export MATE transporter MbnM n=1 Tax=Oscillatoria sp. CS-180 TaxID=3021720 RepID=UPI00232D2E10|nr:methanobactin export MATE transporter MbnM [Oscillatoria sp. CS-180]MDB9529332.1 di-heme enzyme [Oscillatoria sp. CS-180]
MRSRRWTNWILICFLACCLSISAKAAWGHAPDEVGGFEPVPNRIEEFDWQLPSWVPRPVVPDDNPMTAAKVELGRHLFYEPRLSVTGDFSCATCHLQHLAFADGKTLPAGATGEVHPRNSMGLTNVGYNSVQTWANPLMQHLEQQMLVPLFGEEPVELGMAGRENELLQTLQSDSDYQQRFQDAFDDESPVTVRNISLAIAAFERTLNSFDSPYDRYRYGGDATAISDAAKRGEALFNSERLECFHCHGGLNFSDSTRHERSGFTEIAFHNTGLYNIDGNGAYPSDNTGVQEITQKAADMGRFKAPTLRNIEVTAPYMHDGSVATLDEAIAHYSAGGRTISEGPHAGVGSQNPLKSSFIKGFSLTETEKQDLMAFLKSLTDETFLTNPKLSSPFE